MAVSGGHAIRLLELVLVLLFMVITALGLLPALAAFPWDRRTTITFLLANIFLGGTFLVWVVLLVSEFSSSAR
jgi:hypothetical protein